MYGPRFLRDYGEQPSQIWRSAIQGLNDHEIARGFRRLAAHGSASPPTLPQFTKACKQVGEEDGPSRPINQPQLPQPDFCPWKAFANRCLFGFLTKNTGPLVDEKTLAKLVKAKNEITETYKSIASECEVSDDEFVKTCNKTFREIVSPTKKAA